MRSRPGAKIEVVREARQPGAQPWGELPQYVRDRIQIRPWADTEGDRRLQRLYDGYFVCRAPKTQIPEIWVSTPPRDRSGISFLTEVDLKDEPRHAIDERIVFVLRRLDPDRGIDERERRRLMRECYERIEKDRRLQGEIERLTAQERLLREVTDPGKVGRLIRPVRSIVTPANLN